MIPFLAEIIGTALLITLGDGVVANVVLKKTKGNGSGWIVITFGWAMAVFVSVYCVGSFSGAHLNPAVTIGLAITGKFAWNTVPIYILGQMIGSFIGATIVWLQYKQYFQETEDKDSKLAVFCTQPAIRSYANNLLSEIIGTFIFILGVLLITAPEVGIGSLNALPVALLVFAIGLSLGGTTGYAINPARDLGPRIMHSILPVANKGDSDWKYAWIPVIGPIVGSILSSLIYLLII
ncbi:MAG: aquaporin family protein [Ignavibacteriales bacterium]|nr:aquaporin family protein [Ignavibacteriales bacterium]MBK7978727.1 aquaporin family protein [Ignavibacteriota bacterium]